MLGCVGYFYSNTQVSRLTWESHICAGLLYSAAQVSKEISVQSLMSIWGKLTQVSSAYGTIKAYSSEYIDKEASE